ncbi:lipid-A-disaccharide synthase [Pseudidiomarina woesei]|uniref:Lipid-A-disaccharide synthase n=1 Tax=Pseudidiomarina woesei TaxID=1381080 RepID=A0A0K6GWL0_9GAMM|nr:lipid-A-disaccharide synthase [Pseudidiomarina woesei]CUA82975.1 lipid-A-disaccharide synthase [Pseudidiomarina woesei]
MSKYAPLIAVIAGEHSGDLLGSGMLRELRQRYPNAEFIGVGGPLMQAEGLTSLVPMDDLAVMGIAEVLGSLFKLLRHRKLLVNTFLERRPDIFIGIDAPDFNLPIAKKLKAAGLTTVHYVSPSVWAWRQGRIHGIKQSVDHVFCLLPFEKAFYDQHNLPATFVGHPLADSIPSVWDKQQARAEVELDAEATWVGILPGSRKGEIARMAPLFLQVAQQLLQRHPHLRFVTPMISSARAEQFRTLQQQLAPQLPLTIVDGVSRTTMAACDALLLTSGTVTLEAMLIKRPMVVAYKFNWASYQLIKRLFKAAFFSLPNLLAGKRLVPEFAQQDATVENLTDALALQLTPSAQVTLAAFADLHQQLRRNADVLSADVVQQLINR